MTNLEEPRVPESSASLSVGDVVSDRYRIDAVLGEGGMGIVYRVEHLHLRKLYALKVLLPEWSSMTEVVARFEREAVAAGNIQSPHIVAATDFGRLPSGSFFLVMEYVNGRTLRDALDAGALAPARAVHVLRGVVSALHAAHALGIVHRDMKPENIMLVERDGAADFVKVLDFGIARVAGLGGDKEGNASKALTQAGAIIGTPDYMSPEQGLGQPVDARSDLYSVGAILYEMLAGRCLFSGSPVSVLQQHVMAEIPELPADVIASIDPRIGAVLRRLLAKAPENRFANTAELMAALDECSTELPAPPGSTRPSLESVEGMATPTAQRVRTSVVAGLRAIEGAARRSFADARGFLRRATHGRVMTANGLRRAAGSGFRAMERAVQLALADPKALLRYATRGRLMVAAIVAVAIATTIIVLFVAGGTRTPTSTATPVSTDIVGIPASRSPLPTSAPTESVEVAPILPPPPAPSSSTAAARPSPSSGGRPASSQGQSRQTGPGGIYIPPPSQWFK